jgi:hypothetical protein
LRTQHDVRDRLQPGDVPEQPVSGQRHLAQQLPLVLAELRALGDSLGCKATKPMGDSMAASCSRQGSRHKLLSYPARDLGSSSTNNRFPVMGSACRSGWSAPSR